MTLPGTISAGYETGTAANTLATTDAGDITAFSGVTIAASNSLVYDAGTLTVGSLAAKHVLTGTGGANWNWANPKFGTATQFYLRGYFKTTAFGTSTRLFRGVGASSTLAWRIQMNSAGTISLQAGSTTQATSSTVLTTNTIFRVEAYVDHTANAITCRLFVGANAEGSTPTETFSFSGVALGSADTRELYLGPDTVITCTFWSDAIKASTVDWIGAAGSNPAQTVSAVGAIASGETFSTALYGDAIYGTTTYGSGGSAAQLVRTGVAKTVSGVGAIASAETFSSTTYGVAVYGEHTYAGGSAATVTKSGGASLQTISAAGKIASATAFGTPILQILGQQTTVRPAGIATTEAIGRPSLFAVDRTSSSYGGVALGDAGIFAGVASDALAYTGRTDDALVYAGGSDDAPLFKGQTSDILIITGGISDTPGH